MKPRKITAIFALALVLALLTLGVSSFAASSPARVSLDLKQAELAEVFRVLADVSGANIVVSPAVSGKVTVKLVNVPVEEALNIICSVSELEYIYMNGTIMVGLKGVFSKLMDKEVVEKVEMLNISASDAASKLTFAVPGIAAQPDDKSGTLLIRGTQAGISLAKAFLAKVDTPLPPSKAILPEEEVIEIIQLANAEAQSVYDAVTKLLKATLAVDTRLNAILAGGKQTDVKAARVIIEKLDIVKRSTEVAAQPVEIRVMQLTNALAADVKAAAALIISADRIQPDTKSNTLIVKATPEEHARLSDLLKNIEAATPKTASTVASQEKLEIVTLLYAKAADVKAALAVVMPINKIATDERTNKLVLLVDTKTGQEAMALIKALDVKVADTIVPTIAAPAMRLGYYSPKYAKARDIEAIVKLVASAAKLQVIEGNNSIVAYGTDAEHAMIAEALKKLDDEALALQKAAMPVQVESLEVIDLKYAVAADVQKALLSILPSDRISVDTRTNKLLVRATKDEMVLASQIVKAMDVQVTSSGGIPVVSTLEVVQLKFARALDVQKALAAVIPASGISIDERTNKLLLNVTPEEKRLAMVVINELDVKLDVPAAVLPESEALEVVELKFAKASVVKAALDAAFGASKVSVDDRSNKILLMITPSKKQLAMSIIGALDVKVADTPVVQPVLPNLEMAQLKFAKAIDVKKVLDGVLGAPNVSIDERTNKVFFMVTPTGKAVATEIIKNLDVEVAAPVVPVVAPVATSGLEVVQLKYATASEVKKALLAVLAADKITVDDRTNKLMLKVTSDEKQLAMAIINELDVELDIPAAIKAEAKAMEVVELKFAKAADVKKVLDGVLGAPNVSVDERTNKVFFMVTPVDKIVAVNIIKNLDVEVAAPVVAAVVPAPTPGLEVVQLKFARALDVQKALAAVIPASGISIDERTNKLLLNVTPEEKRLAMVVINELDVKLDVPAAVLPESEALEVVELKFAKASVVKAALDAAFGASKVSVDDRSNKILLMITPSKKQLAMSIIGALDVKVADTPVVQPVLPNLEMAQLKFAKAIDVKKVLDGVLGAPNVSIDERTNKVFFMVTPTGKAVATEIIKNLDVEVAAPVVPVVAPVATSGLEVVQLKYATASEVKKALLAVLAADKITVDDRTNKLMLKVTSDEKQLAMAIINELDVEVKTQVGVPAAVETLQIIQLKYAPATEVGKALEAIVSPGKINVDSRTNKLIMKVTTEELAQAKAIVAELDVKLEGGTSVTVEEVQMGFFKLYNVKPTDVEPSVKVIAGTAKVQASDQTSSITAYGTATELKMIEGLIAKLDVKAATEGATANAVMETLEVVQLMNATAVDVKASLSVLLPVSKISINERTNKIMLILTPELKSQAMTIIAALDVPVAKTEAQKAEPVKLGFFQLKYASAKDMEAPVKLVAAGAKVQVADRTNSMIVYGTEAELDLIGEVISKLDVEVKAPDVAAEVPTEYKAYKLVNTSPTEISKALGILLPASSMMPDDRSGTLLIKASLQNQALAADVIATLDVKSVSQASVEADVQVTRVYKLNYASPADLKSALGEVTTGKIAIDTRSSSLIVTAKAAEQAEIVDIIDQLDQELAQVFFEASLYELSDDATKRLGIDWTVNQLVFGYNTLSQLATVSLDFDNKISALAQEGKAKLISKQHTFTVDGKPARMLIGDRIPVIVQRVEQGQVVNSVEYINAGIELTILPKVSYDGSITAEVKPVISSIVGWTPQNYPQIRTRELETIVTVRSGESAIIGGLFSQEEIETISKVPILGDIPLLKELFTKRGTDTKDQEIIIVITAWTIKPGQTTGIKDGIVEIKGPVL